jgi:hypothetical protein
MDKDLFSKFEPFVREGLNDEELAQLQALRESFDAGISEYESLSTQLSDERKARRDLLFKGRTSFEKEEKEVDPQEDEPPREETISIKDLFGKRSDL